MNRVFVSGMGAISPFGVGVEKLWGALLAGASAEQDIPNGFSYYHEPNSRVWAPLPPLDYSSLGISRAEQIKLDPLCLLSFVATSEALENASLNIRCTDEKKRTFRIDGVEPARLGISMGTGLGGSAGFRNYVPHLLRPIKNQLDSLKSDAGHSAIDALIENLDENPRVNPHVICQTMPNAISANLAIRFGALGMVEVACYACAASTIAIHRAISAIKLGEIDLAICGGAEFFGDLAGGVFMGFDKLKALAVKSRTSAAKPFDKNRNGFLFSQGGSGILILESEQNLSARNGTAIVELLDSAITHDASSIVSIDRENNQIGTMLDKLLSKTAHCSDDVTYINAHGTGTIANDAAEAAVIAEKFTHRPTVNSTKGAIGHAIGACGAIELIVTSLSLKEGRTHGNATLEQPDFDLNLPTKTRDIQRGLGITQNMGFGGHNASILVKPC